MKLILLSGGSGKRLFPLSNNVRSKQFLRVLPDELGVRISMLQRVWSQIISLGMAPDTWICASKSHCESIVNQLGDHAPIIQEPSVRDTFPAIVYSAAYLQDVQNVSDNEILTFMPVDPFVDNGFFEKIKTLESALLDSGADIALLGVRPKEASSRFGYIVPKLSSLTIPWMEVDFFEEKPPRLKAQQLVDIGSLWNCGVFAFRAGFLRKYLRDNGLPHSCVDIAANFEHLPRTSFDYAVVEKAERIIVLPYDGSWEDIGTWDVLSKHIRDDLMGIGRVVNSPETNVINELNIPVVVSGANNMMIVACPDGILIANKDDVSDMKTLIDGLDNRPMYEERRWGTYQVLDHRVVDDTEVLVKNICMKAGHSISYQRHNYRREVWTIVKGTGWFADNDSIRKVGTGDVLSIPTGNWHGIMAETDMSFIEVQSGELLVEEDIIRRFMSWDEVVKHFNQPMPDVSN